jgi:hypothetical protein
MTTATTTTKGYILGFTRTHGAWCADGKYPVADQWGREVRPATYIAPDGSGSHDYRQAATFATAEEAVAAREANGWPHQYIPTTQPDPRYKGYYSATPASGEPNGWQGATPPYVGYRVWDRHLEREISRHATPEEAMAAIAALPAEDPRHAQGEERTGEG